MENVAPLPIGRRVAAFRKLRGLTQSGLAARLHRSESWVTKIERGERRIDSIPVLVELSRALAVPVYQLTGQYEVPLGDAGGGEPAGLSELRRVLDRPAIAGRTEDEPQSVAELQRDAAALRRLYNTATYHLSVVLPRLAGPIAQARSAVRVAPIADRPRIHAVLAGLYCMAATGLRHSGDIPRARVAIDRAASAAELSGDPLRVGVVGGFLALQLMNEGGGADGSAVAVEVADLVARLASPEASPVVLGGLYGYAAVAAAKAGEGSEARHLLKAASRAAETLGRDREAHGMFFGPANLATQEMAALVDLDQPRQAVRRAEGVRPAELGSKCRMGQYYAWLATAQARRGDDDSALATLAAGLRVAPELVRQHALARDLVRDMLYRRRRVDEELRRIARAMSIPD